MNEKKTELPYEPVAWRREAAGLCMLADSSEAGKLVRLADVVRWFMQMRNLPVVPAVEALCKELAELSPAPQLYHAREASWAVPMQPDNAFGYFTEETRNIARQRVEAIAQQATSPRHPVCLSTLAPSELAGGWPAVNRETAPDLLDKLANIRTVQPGLPAALRYMQEHWALDMDLYWYIKGQPPIGKDALDDENLLTHNLCIRLQDAQAILADAKPAASQPAQAAPVGEIAKRAALVARLRPEWPTIEADLGEASRNGLHAAKVDGRHGMWSVDKAREWAQQQGKIEQTEKQTATPWLYGAVTRHKMKD